MNEGLQCDINSGDPSDNDLLHNPELELMMLTTEDVDKAIHSIKLGKAAGHDNLTIEHFLYRHPCVVIHLRQLLNAMLKHSYVPAEFGKESRHSSGYFY